MDRQLEQCKARLGSDGAITGADAAAGTQPAEEGVEAGTQAVNGELLQQRQSMDPMLGAASLLLTRQYRPAMLLSGLCTWRGHLS